MSVFAEALSQFPDDDQRKILGVLSRWSQVSGLGRKVDQNLRLEGFLPVPAMQQLLSVLVRPIPTDWEDFEQTYERACWQLSRRGGPVTLSPLPQILGRAVDRHVFERHLFYKHGALFGKSLRRVTSFIDKLLSTPDYDLENTSESAALMTTYSAWVTWDPNDAQADPFAFCHSGRADHIRACLGLTSQDDGRSPEVLLLVYERPSDAPLCRPTVADAATHAYFCPPSPGQGSHHGWTEPWSKNDLPESWQVTTVPPRPEALHEPWPLVRLKLPLRCYS